METNSKQESTTLKVKRWTGHILSGLCILFLLFDSITKVIKATPSVQGTIQLGLPESIVQPLGLIVLAFTILYAIPRTAIFGAILLTAHLGAAVGIFIQHFQGSLAFLFPLIFCVLLWAGLFLKDERLQSIVPLKRQAI